METGGLMPAGPISALGTARNLAVFIDADNLCDPTALDHVLTDVRQRAERVLYKRAYGRAESLKAIESVLWRHGVRPVANMIVNKVTTDSALVIDVVETICTNSIDTVAICSGDADFVPLATWLRERGCQVWCFSLADRIFVNPESFYDDVVLIELVAAIGTETCAVAPSSALPPQLPCPSQPPSVPAERLTPAKVAELNRTQQVLKAFPALRSGLPQFLNEVVAALRLQKVLNKSDKTGVWFRQHAKEFSLFPNPAPNRIVYGQTAAPVTPKPATTPAKLPVPVVPQALSDPALALRQNTRLMTLLKKVVQSNQDARGWTAVSVIRMGLGDKTAFDVQTYGFSTLTKLLAATQIFELSGAGTPQVAARAIPMAPSKSGVATIAALGVMTWPSQHSRRPAAPLPMPFHALRAVLLQVAMQRVRREDVLQAVPELIFGAACALPAVAGRLRAKGLLLQSQSAMRIFERHPQSFVVDLIRYPQSVRHMGTIVS